ncbi:hypothetical protein REPUB_Repub03eG0267800 [Reevesia pubescens]
MDGHIGLANSVALKLAGVTNLSKDLNGGIIMRTADGEPTGLLIGAAMELILARIPEDAINKAGNALSKWIYFGGVKAFADESLGSNSALFHEVRTIQLVFTDLLVNDRYMV